MTDRDAGSPGQPRPVHDDAAGVALVAFLGALLVQALWQGARAASDPLFDAPRLDAAVNWRWATEIAREGVPGTTVFLRGPLYLYVLAACARLGGDDGGRLLAVGLQSVLAAGTAALAGWLASTAVPDASRVRRVGAGLLAAGMTGFAPAALHFAGELLDTTLAAGLLLAFTAAWTRGGTSPGARVLQGILLGLAALARPNALALAPLLLLDGDRLLGVGGPPASHGPPRPRLRPALAGLVACALTLAPATLHNLVRGHTFAPVASTAGINLWLGNRDEGAGMSARTEVLPAGWWSDDGERLRAAASERAGRSLSTGEADGWWLREAARDAAHDPVGTAGRLAFKGWLLVQDVEVPNNLSMRWTRARAGFDAVPLPGMALVVAGVAACLALPARTRVRGELVVAGVTALTVVAFLVNARYRWPLVPILAVPAGVGLADLAGGLRDAWLRARAKPTRTEIATAPPSSRAAVRAFLAAAAGAAVALGGTWFPPAALRAHAGPSEDAHTWQIVARVLRERGDVSGALAAEAHAATLAGTPSEPLPATTGP